MPEGIWMSPQASTKQCWGMKFSLLLKPEIFFLHAAQRAEHFDSLNAETIRVQEPYS